jgi:hypothetical protein
LSWDSASCALDCELKPKTEMVTYAWSVRTRIYLARLVGPEVTETTATCEAGNDKNVDTTWVKEPVAPRRAARLDAEHENTIWTK